MSPCERYRDTPGPLMTISDLTLNDYLVAFYNLLFIMFLLVDVPPISNFNLHVNQQAFHFLTIHCDGNCLNVDYEITSVTGK